MIWNEKSICFCHWGPYTIYSARGPTYLKAGTGHEDRAYVPCLRIDKFWWQMSCWKFQVSDSHVVVAKADSWCRNGKRQNHRKPTVTSSNILILNSLFWNNHYCHGCGLTSDFRVLIIISVYVQLIWTNILTTYAHPFIIGNCAT